MKALAQATLNLRLPDRATQAQADADRIALERDLRKRLKGFKGKTELKVETLTIAHSERPKST